MKHKIDPFPCSFQGMQGREEPGESEGQAWGLFACSVLRLKQEGAACLQFEEFLVP